ncbi:MAG: DUF2752 domain-containing protein [Phycisphaerales bacterium]
MQAPPITMVEARVAVEGQAGSTRRRLVAVAVALAAATILGLAAYLDPSPTGLGTHTQLPAMPTCGWIVTMDLPCPTCGMTTAFAHAANGNLLAALGAQPLGAVLALATAMTLIVGGFTAVTGSRVGSIFATLWGRKAAWILAGGATGAWVYKVLVYRELLG